MAAAIDARFLPVKLISTDARALTRRYAVRWLPAFLMLDGEGQAHHKVIGFLPPADMRAELAFGAGMCAIARKDYDAACAAFSGLREAQPDAPQVPEALFWWGVTRVRQTSDFAEAMKVWTILQDEHPESLAARKIGFAFEGLDA